MTDAVTDPAPAIEFLSAYDQGFARVAAVTLPVVPVDPAANAAAIIEQARTLAEDGVCLAAFPELCLTGYAIDDLLLSDVLLSDVLTAIETLRAASTDLLPALVVGAPIALLAGLGARTVSARAGTELGSILVGAVGAVACAGVVMGVCTAADRRLLSGLRSGGASAGTPSPREGQ